MCACVHVCVVLTGCVFVSGEVCIPEDPDSDGSMDGGSFVEEADDVASSQHGVGEGAVA